MFRTPKTLAGPALSRTVVVRVTDAVCLPAQLPAALVGVGAGPLSAWHPLAPADCADLALVFIVLNTLAYSGGRVWGQGGGGRAWVLLFESDDGCRVPPAAF